MEEVIRQLDLRESQIRSKYVELAGKIPNDNETPLSSSMNKVPLMERFVKEDFKEYIDFYNSISKNLTPDEYKIVKNKVDQFGKGFGIEILHVL